MAAATRLTRRSGERGRALMGTPSGARASATALAMAAEAPAVPPSPAPFTPRGFRGEGAFARTFGMARQETLVGVGGGG